MKSFIKNNINSSNFTIKNNKNKTIKIFELKIAPNESINLLNFGITETIIESSLLKGDLKNRILNKDISVISHNIYFKYDFYDLFNSNAEESNDQLIWYIDPINGNDSANGSTITSPIKTQKEWYKRTNGELNKNTTIILLNNFNSDLIWNIKCIEPNIIFNLQGSLFPILSATVSDFNCWDPASNNEGIITIKSLPKSFSESGLVGKLCKITSGTKAGSTFWICKELEPRKARISFIFNELINEEEINLFPQKEDIITFYDMVELSGKNQIECNNFSFTVNLKNIFFNNLQSNVVNTFSSCCKFLEFKSIPYSNIYSFCNYYNFLNVNNLFYYIIFNSVINGDSNISYSNLEFSNNIIQNGSLTLKNKAFLYLRKYLGIYDSKIGIIIESSSEIKKSDIIFGNTEQKLFFNKFV